MSQFVHNTPARYFHFLLLVLVGISYSNAFCDPTIYEAWGLYERAVLMAPEKLECRRIRCQTDPIQTQPFTLGSFTFFREAYFVDGQEVSYDYYNSIVLRQNKNLPIFNNAINQLKSLAAKGNIEALEYLCYAYSHLPNNIKVDDHLSLALDWGRYAAQHGSAYACETCAKIWLELATADTMSIRKDNAAFWYELAASIHVGRGDLRSAVRYADLIHELGFIYKAKMVSEKIANASKTGKGESWIEPPQPRRVLIEDRSKQRESKLTSATNHPGMINKKERLSDINKLERWWNIEGKFGGYEDKVPKCWFKDGKLVQEYICEKGFDKVMEFVVRRLKTIKEVHQRMVLMSDGGI